MCSHTALLSSLNKKTNCFTISHISSFTVKKCCCLNLLSGTYRINPSHAAQHYMGQHEDRDEKIMENKKLKFDVRCSYTCVCLPKSQKSHKNISVSQHEHQSPHHGWIENLNLRKNRSNEFSQRTFNKNGGTSRTTREYSVIYYKDWMWKHEWSDLSENKKAMKTSLKHKKWVSNLIKFTEISAEFKGYICLFRSRVHFASKTGNHVPMREF